MKIALHSIRLLIGLLFILSGYTKVIDTQNFAGIALQYMDGVLVTALAVLLPPVEIVLGLCLVLGYQVRKVALAVAGLTLFFTLVFAYGVFAKGVTDCGCFGSVEWLKLPVWAVFLRNVFIIASCLWLYVTYEKNIMGSSEEMEWRSYKINALLLMGAIVFTVAGVSFKAPFFKGDKLHLLTGTPAAFTKLNALHLSKDSTYAVFAFSPSCSRCWDASTNAASWKTVGLVDQVIAITPVSQRIKAEKFYLPYYGKGFNKVVYFPDKDFEKLVSVIPDMIVVQKGTVVHTQSGNIPSGYTVKYFRHINQPSKRVKTSEEIKQ